MKRSEVNQAVRDGRFKPVARREAMKKAKTLVTTAHRRVLGVLAELADDDLALNGQRPSNPVNCDYEMYASELQDIKTIAFFFTAINDLLDAIDKELGEPK